MLAAESTLFANDTFAYCIYFHHSHPLTKTRALTHAYDNCWQATWTKRLCFTFHVSLCHFGFIFVCLCSYSRSPSFSLLMYVQIFPSSLVCVCFFALIFHYPFVPKSFILISLFPSPKYSAKKNTHRKDSQESPKTKMGEEKPIPISYPSVCPICALARAFAYIQGTVRDSLLLPLLFFPPSSSLFLTVTFIVCLLRQKRVIVGVCVCHRKLFLRVLVLLPLCPALYASVIIFLERITISCPIGSLSSSPSCTLSFPRQQQCLIQFAKHYRICARYQISFPLP